MSTPPRESFKPHRAGLFVVIACLVGVMAACADSPPKEASAFGPNVDRIPADAVSLVVISPMDVAKDTKPYSWLVFLNALRKPIGYRIYDGLVHGQAAITQSKAIAIGAGDFVEVITDKGVQQAPSQPNGRGWGAYSTPRDSGLDAYLWLDAGIGGDGNQMRATQINVRGQTAMFGEKGYLAAQGYCKDTYYYALFKGSSGPAGGTMTLKARKTGANQSRHIASWHSGFSIDRGRTIVCAADGRRVELPLISGTDGPIRSDDSGPDGLAGMRLVDPDTGTSTFRPLNEAYVGSMHERLSAAGGSNVSWSELGRTFYIDMHGNLQSVANAADAPRLEADLIPGIPVADRYITAASVNFGTVGMIAYKRLVDGGLAGRDSIVWVDLHTRKEIARDESPDWLTGVTASTQYEVTDLISLR
ncbi:hypothetical protein [Gordonia effusa]|nr:hypothetical protein [Gordonia effusa]